MADTEFSNEPTRRRGSHVILRDEVVEPREFTATGIPVGPRRRPAARERRFDLFALLVDGPHMRALELGGYYEAFLLRRPRR